MLISLPTCKLHMLKLAAPSVSLSLPASPSLSPYKPEVHCVTEETAVGMVKEEQQLKEWGC